MLLRGVLCRRRGLSFQADSPTAFFVLTPVIGRCSSALPGGRRSIVLVSVASRLLRPGLRRLSPSRVRTP